MMLKKRWPCFRVMLSSSADRRTAMSEEGGGGLVQRAVKKAMQGAGWRRTDETLLLNVPLSEMNGVVRCPALQPVLVYEGKKSQFLGWSETDAEPKNVFASFFLQLSCQKFASQSEKRQEFAAEIVTRTTQTDIRCSDGLHHTYRHTQER